MRKETNMKDLVIAVYRRECYAGETTMRLVKVFADADIPEEYLTNEYELKVKRLIDYIAE